METLMLVEQRKRTTVRATRILAAVENVGSWELVLGTSLGLKIPSTLLGLPWSQRVEFIGSANVKAPQERKSILGQRGPSAGPGPPTQEGPPLVLWEVLLFEELGRSRRTWLPTHT